MSANQNPDKGEFDEEASKVSPDENRDQRQDAEAELAARKREFEDALQKSDQNVENAGRDAARKLGEGFLQGLGRRAAERLWDIFTGNQS